MTTSGTIGSLADILTLLNDPTFLLFEADQEAPTIFNAVGRTHTETWHSALLGWLLDPRSSHGLGTYPLTRLLLLLQTQDELDTRQREVNLHHILVQGNLENARVRPNERDLTEVSVATVGRFDVLIDSIVYQNWTDVQVLIEVKVKAAIDQTQCNKYIEYSRQRRKDNVYLLPVFVAPSIRLSKTPIELFGNDAWIPVSFQEIYDDVIEPSLAHNDISVFGRFTLQEYVKTLKYRLNGGEPLALTQTDREMVQTLFERHEPALRALYEILSQSIDDFEPVQVGGTAAKVMIKILVDGKTIFLYEYWSGKGLH